MKPICIVLAVSGLVQAAEAAPSLATLYTFSGGADGAYPASSLLPGGQGSFFGSAQAGGAASSGTIFQLLPPAKGSTTWSLNPLYSFAGGADGYNPYNIIINQAGQIFGETLYGGNSNATNCGSTACGTVFELVPPAQGQTQWTKLTLYSFTGNADGHTPTGLTLDNSGNLYGFTYGGNGSCGYNGTVFGCGTVYQLSPPPQGQTTWTYHLLYTFAKFSDGEFPAGAPLLDSAGAIYGTTGFGGPGAPAACAPATGCGIVFKISPPSGNQKTWQRSALFAFDGTNGIGGPTSLIADGNGNFYGTTNEGGTDYVDCPASQTYGYPGGCGTAFELSPPANGKKKWKLTSIWSFDNGADGSYPYNTGLTPVGGAYYTTSSGAYPIADTYGSIVKFTPPGRGGGAWTEATLFTFSNDANGAQPSCALLSRGTYLYGTTTGTGSGGAPYGTIFRIKP
jgi:hypothetical protein